MVKHSGYIILLLSLHLSVYVCVSVFELVVLYYKAQVLWILLL